MAYQGYRDELNLPPCVPRVSMWLWLAGAALLLAALLCWGFFGRVARRADTCAVYRDGQWVCFVDAETARYVTDAAAAVTGGAPISYEAAAAVLADPYYIERAGLGLWNARLTLAIPGEASEGDARDVALQLESARPFDLIGS